MKGSKLIMDNLVNDVLSNPGFSAFNTEKKIAFVRPYDAKAVAIPSFRNAVIRYWTAKGEKAKGVVAKPAQMVTVPQVTLPDSDYLLPEKAQTVLIGVLEDQQDTLIKSLILNGASIIDWEDVSIENCFNALTAVRVSKRLLKDNIINWAKIALAPVFALRAKELTLNAPQNFSAQVAKTTNSYVDLLGSLSAPVPNLDTKQCEACVSILKRANLDDDMSRALFEKLNALLNPAIVEDSNL